MGIGDWGLGPIPNPQSPIPKPQTPFPLSQNEKNEKIIKLKFKKLYYLTNKI